MNKFYIHDGDTLGEDGDHELLMAFFGTVPLEVVTGVIDVYEKRYPGCLVLSGEHPLSLKLGAMMVLVRPV